MKKYIFIALAAAGTMACSKLTPVDNIPVTELPEDETTETVAPKEGETITIQLAQTKVTLNGTDYVFEGNEQIVVKAASGPVATLSNSTKDPNIFTGVFEKPLGKEKDIFDFYYNCTDASGKASYVQNGQPWLEHKGVEATRAPKGGYAYVVEGVQLRQPEAYVAIAITSDDYDCTVSFNTRKDDLPTGGKTIKDIAVSAGKPYFVNVSKGLTGGFYLAVSKTGETGTMYTSYGTSAPINANTSVKVKAFTPMNISGSLTGFETTYDLYKTKGAASANSESNDYMAGGKLKISVQGISNSLLSLDRITITSSDGKTLGSSTSKPVWSNKEYTWYFNAPSSHTKWGKLTVTATAVFNTPAGKVTAKVPALSRHITGLPYMADFDSNRQKWLGWTPNNAQWYKTSMSVYKVNISSNGSVTSPQFYIPSNIPIKGTSNVQYYKITSGSANFKFGTCTATSSGPQNEITKVSVSRDMNTIVSKSQQNFTSTFSPSHCFFSVSSDKDNSIVYDVVIQYK